MLGAQDRRSRPGPARPAARPTAAVPAGSSWAVGSSRTRRPVPIVTMLAMATRCCSPPDRANGSRSARWAMPSRSRTASIRPSISARGRPRFSRPKASSSRTVSFEADSWLAGVEKTIPTRPRSAPAVGVSRAMPPSGRRPATFARTTRGMNPAATRARVDLPAPGPAGDADPLARPDRQVDPVEGGLAATDVADADRLEDEVGRRRYAERGLRRRRRRRRRRLGGHRPDPGHGQRRRRRPSRAGSPAAASDRPGGSATTR